MKEKEPEALRVALMTGVQTPEARLVVASTLTGMLVVPAMLKPKRSEAKPKPASRWTVGFQHSVGRPPKVVPQPVVPGR